MKKKYISPETKVIKIEMTQKMLTGSGLPLNNNVITPNQW